MITTVFVSHFPTSWKVSTSIPKPRKSPKSPTSYRPISLLSHVSKLTEKIILKRPTDFDDLNSITCNHQFGFRSMHSRVQQLARVITNATAQFKKNVCVMTLLDVEMAFDRVRTDGLVTKLERYGFPLILVKLIQTYLTNRSLRVRVNESLSSVHPIRVGVVQGLPRTEVVHVIHQRHPHFLSLNRVGPPH